MIAAALSNIPIRSAMEITDGILIYIWELLSSLNFQKPDKFNISCIFKEDGSFDSFGKENCCFSALSLFPVTFSDTQVFFFSFLIKLNYFL